MDIPNVNLITEKPLFLLGSKLITEREIYRYMSDGTYYKWVNEIKWNNMNKIEHPERFFTKTTLDWIKKAES